ncbi:hypothetical protein Sinac_4388 [Singulisphaera acidiphila DSM 18658]|uniref:Uncharacterized protein n=1 Tax=Singulisphaera acidiphila (strain ATCC BAA-1392 / DSM 18658 / VKM B-2454 / MOB10) TaxID=886293 RepID=L0DGS0_SINAD|nr:hypothetical protein Sinac_4388 [Singulisphaera acidiphila DSM 18658]
MFKRGVRLAPQPDGTFVLITVLTKQWKIMKATTGSFSCPCCGYNGLSQPPYRGLADVSAARGLEPPYEEHFGAPSYEVCDCCGFEFGNDDNPGTGVPASFEEHLREWVRSGCEWFDATKRPEGWQLEEQLERAGLPA